MNSDETPGESEGYPTSEAVLAGIGEKPIEAFSLCVTRARHDLHMYRETFPVWVADHSERGLANWISDRIWAHLLGLADSISDMEMIEKGVTREVTIGVNYRFRVKRHSEDGMVASYETPTFLEFVSQRNATTLPGMEETRLIAGYDWIKDLRNIGSPVISLRDGRDNIIWKATLPEVPDEDTGDGGSTAPVVTPERPGPTGPVVDVRDTVGQDSKETTEDE